MAANELFDTGIKITGSFSAAGAFPADSKSVVETIAERDDHVTQNRAYEGMEVYVKATQTKYRYVNGEWVDVNKYTHPQYNSQSTGLYKIEVENGHIKSAIEVTKQDIIELGFAPAAFIAQYDKTTWEEIDEAVLSNIPVFVEVYSIDNTNNTILAKLTKYSATSYVFTAFDIDKIYQFTCHYMDGWVYETKSFVQSSTAESYLSDTDGNIVVDNDGVTVTAN